MRFDGKARALVALLAIGLAIVCGALAGLLGSGHFAGRYAVPAQGSEARIAPPSPAPVAAPRPPVVTATLPPPTNDADDDGDAPDDGDRERIAGAIGRATRKALDRGEPVRWHKAGQRGYVVVSDIQSYPGRSCRMVSATILDDAGRETRSAPHLWCQTDADEDGDWHPAD